MHETFAHLCFQQTLYRVSFSNFYIVQEKKKREKERKENMKNIAVVIIWTSSDVNVSQSNGRDKSYCKIRKVTMSPYYETLVGGG